ncbi:hypothetical protein GCM10027187_28610 [Streptosporangium sandarakinum]
MITLLSTIPSATVAATFNDRKAPAKFSTADSPTAAYGRNAPVATDVATAFAASWNPLVKAKTNAAATTTVSSKGPVSMPDP